MSPLAYLAFLGITGGLPAGQHDPARIAALIRDLDSYRFAQRDAAGKQLLSVGLPALNQIKQALAASPTPEAAEQLRRIAREIRHRGVTGGRIVAGMRATLRTSEDTYREADEIALDLEVTNLTRESCPIHAPTWWKLSHGTVPDNIEMLSRPVDGEIHIRLLHGRQWRKDCFFPTAEKRSKSPSELLKGQALGERISLSDHGRDLPVGDYEIELVLHGTPLSAINREPLISNTVRFTIVPRNK